MVLVAQAAQKEIKCTSKKYQRLRIVVDEIGVVEVVTVIIRVVAKILIKD